ncbi:hypothetical protein [Brevundimonas naejangsanensis]
MNRVYSGLAASIPVESEAGVGTMLERAARSAYESPHGPGRRYDDLNETGKGLALHQVRAVLMAVREPDDAMLDAAKPWPKHWPPFDEAERSAQIAFNVDRAAASSQWRNMIDAILKDTTHDR